MIRYLGVLLFIVSCSSNPDTNSSSEKAPSYLVSEEDNGCSSDKKIMINNLTFQSVYVRFSSGVDLVLGDESKMFCTKSEDFKVSFREDFSVSSEEEPLISSCKDFLKDDYCDSKMVIKDSMNYELKKTSKNDDGVSSNIIDIDSLEMNDSEKEFISSYGKAVE